MDLIQIELERLGKLVEKQNDRIEELEKKCEEYENRIETLEEKVNENDDMLGNTQLDKYFSGIRRDPYNDYRMFDYYINYTMNSLELLFNMCGFESPEKDLDKICDVELVSHCPYIFVEILNYMRYYYDSNIFVIDYNDHITLQWCNYEMTYYKKEDVGWFLNYYHEYLLTYISIKNTLWLVNDKKNKNNKIYYKPIQYHKEKESLYKEIKSIIHGDFFVINN